jgi:release factor glutamine methyltransferase
LALTLATALRQANDLLEQESVSSARFTAELLLAHALKVDRVYLRAHPERLLTDVEQVHLARYLRDRMAGVPTQYITGHQEFWGLDIRVNPSVLIPRPETEHVVERALAVADRTQPLKILDCGTGSGCIALALTTELPRAHTYASDISLTALHTARTNAQRLGQSESITFVCGDLLACFPDTCFDLILSNPPYIAFSESPTLAQEVRDHEPAAALFAGSDAAAVYRRLIPDAARVLRPGGWVIVELGIHLADPVRALFTGPAWHSPATDRDLAGIERVLYAQRS